MQGGAQGPSCGVRLEVLQGFPGPLEGCEQPPMLLQRQV